MRKYIELNRSIGRIWIGLNAILGVCLLIFTIISVTGVKIGNGIEAVMDNFALAMMIAPFWAFFVFVSAMLIFASADILQALVDIEENTRARSRTKGDS